MDIVERWAEVGERVREARLAADLTQVDLGRRIGVERDVIAKIEGGDRRVTALEAARLAEAVSLPMTLLLSRRPAAITAHRAPLAEDLGGSGRAALRADLLLEAHAADARWLVEHGYLTPPARMDTLTVSDRESACAAASRVRAHLGLTTEPLGSLADIAEHLGVYLLAVGEKVEGASLDEGPWGVAVIGALRDPGRRRATAAHEVAHHIAGDTYSSDFGVASTEDERERVIDVLAAALLLPGSVVSARLASLADPQARWQALVGLSATYRTSWSLAVQVAQDEGSLTPGERQRLIARTPTLGDLVTAAGGPVSSDLTPGSTGARWQLAVLTAYRDGAITADRCVELLHGLFSTEDLPVQNVEETYW